MYILILCGYQPQLSSNSKSESVLLQQTRPTSILTASKLERTEIYRRAISNQHLCQLNPKTQSSSALIVSWLDSNAEEQTGANVALSFLDPTFNQGKKYRSHNDSMTSDDYWCWMTKVCGLIFEITVEGGSIYFMQREKNVGEVLTALNRTGWDFQNLTIWAKKTSAIPSMTRHGKGYQVIVFATKGKRPVIFNKLRIDPLLPSGYRPRTNGVFVTDVWSGIRELTSGYFASDEALRNSEGEREHKQQSPIALLLRIILSSTTPGMTVFDPFAGTGTTSVVAPQLSRKSISLEIDSNNAKLIQRRLKSARHSDNVEHLRKGYQHTPNLSGIWPPPY